MALKADTLIALDNVSLSISAGIEGKGLCSVRLLESVSLSVNRGELLIVDSGDEKGGKSILQALNGVSLKHSASKGNRFAVSPLEVHRGAVPTLAISQIACAWQLATLTGRMSVCGVRKPCPRVYLLRVDDKLSCTPNHIQRWYDWGLKQRLSNFAMVVVGKGVFRHSYGVRSGANSSALVLKEGSVDSAVATDSPHIVCPSVRRIVLRGGRIESSEEHFLQPLDIAGNAAG